jgi:hypothetical protein
VAFRWGIAAALAAGCAGEEAPCVALVDGDWVLDSPGEGSGAPFGTPVGAVLTMDPEGCTFALDWNMGVSLPSGGAIDGDELTLAGDDEGWATCVGDVAADGASVDGSCDSGAFTMALDNSSFVRLRTDERRIPSPWRRLGARPSVALPGPCGLEPR